jgi:arabinofuranosyltransferase
MQKWLYQVRSVVRQNGTSECLKDIVLKHDFKYTQILDSTNGFEHDMEVPRHRTVLAIVSVALAIIAYTLLARHLNFYQDDAYISYRYVANYLNGDGLVYNIGERIEGMTNFGWVNYLAFWGVLGLNYILASKVTGLVLGAIVIVLTYLVAGRVFGDKHPWFAIAAVFLVGMNQSLAYWSPAGLETAAFAAFAMASLYFYLTRSYLLMAALTGAVLLRPEGALVAGILVFVEFSEHRRFPGFTVINALLAFVAVLPMLGFKLAYYGSIVPNPFHAKTTFGWSQVGDGLEYAGRFFSHYGLYGIGLLVPLAFWRSLSSASRAVWLFSVVYILYVVVIGGDVLKVHRFFLPILGTSAVLIVLSIWLLVRKMRQRSRLAILVITMIPLLALTYFLPRDFVEAYNQVEKAFVRKMRFKAQSLERSDATDFTVALPTIGVFGYELTGHTVIDMLGLTDTTIAKYAEPPIPGMQTTWKERRYNSQYLLTRAPDYILFSTELKPSAPAEMALLLYPQFIQCYRKIGWYYQDTVTGNPGALTVAYKKVRPVRGPFRATYPLAYVEQYKLGLEAVARGDFRTASGYIDRALEISPRPYWPDLVYHKAMILGRLGREVQADSILAGMLADDSLVFEAHRYFYIKALAAGDREKAELHRRWLQRLVSWYLPVLEASLRSRTSPSR